MTTLREFKNLFYSVCDFKEVSEFKVICKNGVIIGGHIVGKGSDEIISLLAVAIKCKLTMAQLMNVVSVHPSASEELFSMHLVA